MWIQFAPMVVSVKPEQECYLYYCGENISMALIIIVQLASLATKKILIGIRVTSFLLLFFFVVACGAEDVHLSTVKLLSAFFVNRVICHICTNS